MTAQVGDKFTYKKHEYSIVAISNPIDFTPQDYGIIPQSCSSGCWAGYWCEYDISDDGITLKNLYVNSKDDYYPEINGVNSLYANKNSKDRFKYMGHHLYKEINIKLPYTGRILVGKEFLREYYIHMGYQRAWSYKVLTEFVFEDGILIETLDHSKAVAELRKKISEEPDFMDKLRANIPMFVENSFSLDMVIKACWIKDE